MMSALAGIAGGKGTPSRAAARQDVAKPLRLIYTDSDGKFVLDPVAKKTLEQLKGPVGVVAVCGKARQGKSFVLNQLLGRTSGFEVGPTHRPCTKGLWMWSAPIKVGSPTGEHYHMILLDTEGIDATDQTGTYSTQIFSLGVLLSSTFVYNQMGPIDEAALDKLSLITEMVKNIKLKATSQSKSSSAAELAQFAPFFLWLLRDFYLELQEDGREITPKEYLEISLRPAAGSDRAVVSKNEVRELIRSLFPDRDCFALVRPVTDERDLHRLSSIPMNKFRPEFLSGLKNLTDLIFSKTRPKQMDGMMLTGPALAGMAQCFITAINGGAVPVISTSWEHVAESECRRATEKATEAYWDALDRTVAAEEELLNEAHKKAVEAAIAVFAEEAVGGGSIRLKFEQALVNLLAKLFEDYKANLFKDAELRCSNILDSLRKELMERCRDPSTTLNGFFKILDELLVRYERDMCGPAKWRYLVRFMYQSVYETAREVMQRSMDTIQKKLDTSLAEYATLRASNTVVEDQCNSLKKTCEGLQKDLTECRRKLDKTLDESLSAARDARKKEDALRAEQASALALKDQEIKELLGRGEKSTKDTLQLAEQLKEKDISLAVLGQELKALKVELKRLHGAADQAHLQATNAEKDVKSARAAEAAAVKERDRAMEQAEAAARARKAAEDELKHLAELEKESRTMAMSASKEKEEIRVVEARLKTELLEARRLLEANKQAFADRESELEEEIVQLHLAVKSLEDKLSRESGGKTEAIHTVEMLEAELSRLKLSHEDLRQKLEKRKELENELEKKVQELQRQVLSGASQVAAAVKERDNVKGTLERTMEMLEETRKRAEEARSLIAEKERSLCEEEQGKMKAICEIQELLAVEKVERMNAEKREASAREEVQRLQQQMVSLKGDLDRIKKEKEGIEVMVQDMERAREANVQEVTSKHTEAVKKAASWKEKFEKMKENSDLELRKAQALLAQAEEEKRNAKERLEDAMLHAKRQLDEAARTTFQKEREVEAVQAELKAVREDLTRTKEQEMGQLRCRAEAAEGKARVLEQLKDDALAKTEDLTGRLSRSTKELQMVQQQLLEVKKREEELGSQLKAYTAAADSIGAPGRLKRRRVVEAMDIDENMGEVDQLSQQNGAGPLSVRRQQTTLDMMDGGCGKEVVEACPMTPAENVLAVFQSSKEYEKWTITKLKQELTKHEFGHEVLKLGRPTKKDLLALYERCVVCPKTEESG